MKTINSGLVIKLVTIAATLVLAGCVTTADQPNLPLENRLWSLKQIGWVPAIEGGNANLTFNKYGTVTGGTGCNSFSGNFAKDQIKIDTDVNVETGSGLHFGDLAATRKLCEDALNTQESKVFKALDQVKFFDIRENELRLKDDEDRLMLLYTTEALPAAE